MMFSIMSHKTCHDLVRGINENVSAANGAPMSMYGMRLPNLVRV